MGATEGTDGLPDEHPERREYLSSFLLDRLEVTNQAYAAFVQAMGYRPPVNSNPARTLWENNHPIPALRTIPSSTSAGKMLWPIADGPANAFPPKPNGKKLRAVRPTGATRGEQLGLHDGQ